MKVLLADGLRPKAQELLKQNNIDIVVKFYKLDELISVIAEFDGIIVRSIIFFCSSVHNMTMLAANEKNIIYTA